jgi:uncharacterized membrane protein YgcG
VKVRAGRLGVCAIAATGFVLGGLLATACSSAPTDEGWVITSFQSDITIAHDSTLTIREAIDVDFASKLKHGIFRTIPLRYRFDDTRDRYFNLRVKSVTDGARALPYHGYVESDNQVIKIGDPNVQVSGTQRYVITYTVEGAMNSFADHDELFWNVDGALWPAAKSKVEATVHLPSAAFQKGACYQGAPGSTATCNYSGAGTTASYSSTRRLPPGEEMSVVTALTTGAVAVPPPLLEPRVRNFPQDAFDLTPLSAGLFLVLLVAGGGLVAWNWWSHGRDRAYLTQYYLTHDPRQGPLPLFHHDPVVVEFEAPQKMRPAELGLILDESADAKDVTATIVDLAVRGFMTIAEVPDEQKDWTFTWKAGGDAAVLLPYEKTILDTLFAGRQTVKLSELKGTFAPTLRAAEDQIYSDALSRRLFSSNPQHARAAWGCLGIAIMLVGGAVSVILGVTFGWGLLGVAIFLTGIAMAVSFPFMPQRTAAGRDLMQHTLGFRLYMTTAEKYRQQFAAKAQIFTQLLPYAIVFGCVSLWAKAFEGIDTSQANSWYTGAVPFQAGLLASNLESMNSNISSALVYSPSTSGGSSGFGGGGFSGGGGGGGGGGSW